VETAASVSFIRKSIRQFSATALAESRLPDGRLPQVVVLLLRRHSMLEYSHSDSQARHRAVFDPGIPTAGNVRHTNRPRHILCRRRDEGRKVLCVFEVYLHVFLSCELGAYMRVEFFRPESFTPEEGGSPCSRSH
jgi:hypothetical protein